MGAQRLGFRAGFAFNFKLRLFGFRQVSGYRQRGLGTGSVLWFWTWALRKGRTSIKPETLKARICESPKTLKHQGQDLGFRVWGLGFRVQGLGLRVQGLGFRVQGSGFRA